MYRIKVNPLIFKLTLQLQIKWLVDTLGPSDVNKTTGHKFNDSRLPVARLKAKASHHKVKVKAWHRKTLAQAININKYKDQGLTKT